MGSSGIFGGAPSSAFNQPAGTNATSNTFSSLQGFTPHGMPSTESMNQFFGQNLQWEWDTQDGDESTDIKSHQRSISLC